MPSIFLVGNEMKFLGILSLIMMCANFIAFVSAVHANEVFLTMLNLTASILCADVVYGIFIKPSYAQTYSV